MTRDLEVLTLAQLIALGFQNKLPMKYLPKGTPYRDFLIKGLGDLKVIKGLETAEDGC